MPFKPFLIDDSIERIGGGSIYVPEGEYVAKFTGVTPSPEDHKSEYNFFTYGLQLTKGVGDVGVGVKINRLQTFKEDAHWGHGNILAYATGRPEILQALKGKGAANYTEFKQMAESFQKIILNKEIGITIADRQNNGKTFSEVVAFWPAEEFGVRSNLHQAAPARPAMGGLGSNNSTKALVEEMMPPAQTANIAAEVKDDILSAIEGLL